MNSELENRGIDLPILTNYLFVLRESKDPTEIQYVLEVIHARIRGKDDLKLQVGRQGGSRILLKYMQSDNSELQVAAAKVFRSASVNEENRSIMADEGAASKLVEILESTENYLLRMMCISSLWNLALNEISRREILEKGGIRALVRLLNTEDTRMLNEVLGALRVFSEDEEGKRRIGQEGAVSHLIRLIHLSNERIQRLSALILKNICINDKKNRRLLETGGGRDKLLQILSRNRAEYQSKTALPKDVVNKYFDEAINWEDLVLIKEVGEGRYGNVYMAKYHNFLVACKVIKNRLTAENVESMLEELRLMRRLKHPNVVLLLGACLNPSDQVVIVTEFLAHGNLKGCLNEIKSLHVRMGIVVDIAQGLNWLHAHQVIHRDLKLANLLVDKDYTVKISDFGLSLDLRKDRVCRDFRGNLKYSPPEILRARYDDSMPVYQYTEKTDVYSFGLIFWELISYKPLFANMQGKDDFTNMVLMGERPRLLRHWPESMRELLRCCWNENAARRPFFSLILKQLEVIYVDLLCPDPLGKRICKRLWKFRRHAIISSCDFEQVLCELSKPDSLGYRKNIRYLLALLCDPYDDTIRFERFCQVLSWFGPLHPVDTFLKRIKYTLRLPAFHGDLSVQKATALIRDCYYQHSVSGNRSKSSTSSTVATTTHHRQNGTDPAPRSLNHPTPPGSYSSKKQPPASRSLQPAVTELPRSPSVPKRSSRSIAPSHLASSNSSSDLFYDTHYPFFSAYITHPSGSHCRSTFLPSPAPPAPSRQLPSAHPPETFFFSARRHLFSRPSYFLYRFSSIAIGAFILTYVDKDGYVFHKKIQHEGDKYFIDDFSIEFTSFRALHKFCKHRFKLRRHVPGSIYQSLFS